MVNTQLTTCGQRQDSLADTPHHHQHGSSVNHCETLELLPSFQCRLFSWPQNREGRCYTAPPRHHIRRPTTTLCNGARAPFVLGWALEEIQPPAMIGICLKSLAATAATDSARL